MSDTPETDAFSGNLGDWIKFAEKLERERAEAIAQVMQMQIHANNYLSESQVWRQMAIQLAEDILLDGNASSRLIVKASKVQKAMEAVK